MGPYCQFCDHRCFVERWIPNSTINLFATCAEGAAEDRRRLGYDHESALNTSDPLIREYAQQVAAVAVAEAAKAIERVAANPDARRPLKTGAVHGTDLANDFEWCAKIVRSQLP